MARVRAATLGDVTALHQLASTLAARAPGHPDPAAHELSEASHRRTLERLVGLEGARLVVAERDGRVVGYMLGFVQPALYAGGPVGWVQEVAVDEAFRRQGLGRKLMDDFEGWARARGAVLVALATRRAAAFYESLGYSASATYFKKYLTPQ